MSSTDIARREGQLATLTDEQVDLVKRTIAPDATDDELALFIQQCNRTGLDPFAKQIYSIKRKSRDPLTDAWVETRQTQISIDGARLIADRTRRYAPGVTSWCGPDGKWREPWLDSEPPAAAKVTVLKDGVEVPGVATFAEFVQRNRDGAPTRMWKAMPAHMLAKCAEMLALRKAFPQELSGLVVQEEPELPGPKPVTTVVGEELATDEQLAAIADGFAKLLSNDVSQDALDEKLRLAYPEVGPEADIRNLTRPHANELLERLSGGAA